MQIIVLEPSIIEQEGFPEEPHIEREPEELKEKQEIVSGSYTYKVSSFNFICKLYALSFIKSFEWNERTKFAFNRNIFKAAPLKR